MPYLEFEHDVVFSVVFVDRGNRLDELVSDVKRILHTSASDFSIRIDVPEHTISVSVDNTTALDVLLTKNLRFFNKLAPYGCDGGCERQATLFSMVCHPAKSRRKGHTSLVYVG